MPSQKLPLLPLLRHLQLVGALIAMLLILVCLANLMGLLDAKPDCIADQMFYLKGTDLDCAVPS